MAKQKRPQPASNQQLGEMGIQSQSMLVEPSEEDIRMRAYHRFLQRGGANGMDFDDWLEAERELKELIGKR
jgi:hypothetical protein